MTNCIFGNFCYSCISLILLLNCDNLPHCHDNHNVVAIVLPQCGIEILLALKIPPGFWGQSIVSFWFPVNALEPGGLGGSIHIR